MKQFHTLTTYSHVAHKCDVLYEEGKTINLLLVNITCIDMIRGGRIEYFEESKEGNRYALFHITTETQNCFISENEYKTPEP